MRKFGSAHFDDPDDLSEWSHGFYSLFIQLESLDFARRYYKRQQDKTSQKRANEINKLFHKISDMQTQAIRALVPEEVTQKWSEIYVKKYDQSSLR